jgi:hypothetical protein
MFYALDPGGSPLPPATNAGPHSAGWLSWFVVGAVTLVVVLAWLCLRGYRSGSDNQ